MKNKIFQSRDLCLRALDTNSACAKSVRRNEEKNERKRVSKKSDCGSNRSVWHAAGGFVTESGGARGRGCRAVFEGSPFTGRVSGMETGLSADKRNDRSFWISYVAANIGRDAAISIATEYGTHIVPAFYIVYPAMGFLFLALLVMTASGKTIYSKKMLLVQPIIWMAVGALIPDIKQAFGCRMYTLDYVIIQSSGNFAPFIYFLACLLLPESFKMKKGQVCK